MSEPISPSPTVEHQADPQPEQVPAAVADPADKELVVEDLLVEEISIDGMCGVY